MSPEVNAATKVGACRMKIISEGTPYLEKKPCSLAAQSGRTRALTAAWAMMVLAGADAASRAFSEIDSPRTTKKNATHLLIVHPFPGYSSGATADTRTSRHNEIQSPSPRSSIAFSPRTFLLFSCEIFVLADIGPVTRPGWEESQCGESVARTKRSPPRYSTAHSNRPSSKGSQPT